MKYIHNETGEEWNGQSSTKQTSNFYLLSHDEKVERGWTLVQEPIVEVPLEDWKKQEVARVESSASMYVTGKYPVYKQINALLGIYGEEYKQEMITFIQGVRSKVAQHRVAIPLKQDRTPVVIDFQVTE